MGQLMDELYVFTIENANDMIDDLVDGHVRLSSRIVKFSLFVLDMGRHDVGEFVKALVLNKNVIRAGGFLIFTIPEGSIQIFHTDHDKLFVACEIIEKLLERNCNVLEVINAAIDIVNLK